MKKFSFEERQGVWSSHFKEAGFGVTYFTYEPLAMMVYMRGVTKEKTPIYLVLWTVPDEYLSDAILVLTKEEYIKEYEKHMNDPEYDKEEESGNPNIPDSEYSPIDEDKLKGIIQYCEVDWEEFKNSIQPPVACSGNAND